MGSLQWKNIDCNASTKYLIFIHRSVFIMNLTPLKAIRKKCLECKMGSYKKVRDCISYGRCPLYQYRLGRNVRRSNIGGKPTHLTRIIKFL